MALLNVGPCMGAGNVNFFARLATANDHEPGCAIKLALEQGLGINTERYRWGFMKLKVK